MRITLRESKHPLASLADKVNIVMPIIVWPRDNYSPLPVNWKSPKEQRMAVWRLSQFFRREFSYDFEQYGYEGDESDDPEHVAYLWAVPQCDLANFRVHCIGATCFRKRETRMAMQWIWIHPFFRRRGLLTQAWPKFVREHGDFYCEPPFSDAMEAFLKNQQEPTPVT